MKEKLVAVVSIPGVWGPLALRQDIRVMGTLRAKRPTAGSPLLENEGCRL